MVFHIIRGAVGLCCPLIGHHCLVSLGASVPLPSKREAELGHWALVLATCSSGIWSTNKPFCRLSPDASQLKQPTASLSEVSLLWDAKSKTLGTDLNPELDDPDEDLFVYSVHMGCLLGTVQAEWGEMLQWTRQTWSCPLGAMYGLVGETDNEELTREPDWRQIVADTMKGQREAELAKMRPVSDRGDGGGLSEESWCNGAKDSCACHTESQALTVGVCSKGKVYYRLPWKWAGEKPQIHSNLVVEFGVFLKEKNKEAAINHQLWHFLIMILGVRMSLVYDSLARWAMAGGPWASLVLERQPEFVL